MSLEQLEKELAERVTEDAEWEGNDASFERFKKVAIGLISFFGLVILVAGIILYFVLTVGTRGVDLSLTLPDTVTVGVPFDVVATVSNNQDVLLGDATLRLDLPPELIYLGVANSEGGSATTDKIGDVGAGSFVKHTFRLVSTGSPNTTESLRITASYLSGKSSRFEVKGTKDVRVGESPVELSVIMPDHILRGSSFEFEVSYKNISSADLTGATLQLSYPDSFRFESASQPAEAMNNLWKLGDIKTGVKGSLKIKGTYMGYDDAPFDIPVVMSTSLNGKDYPIAQTKTTATLAPSPIPLTILVNGQNRFVAHLGDTLAVTIHYENKSGVALSNVILKTSLASTMVDLATLETTGQSDGASGWLTWDSSTVPAFRLLDAGATGDVTLSVKLKNTFPIASTRDKNYSIKISARLESPTVPFYATSNKTVSTANNEVKIAGLVGLSSQLFFRDVEVDVENAGPFPPKVGTPTEFLAHWNIKNFSTDLSNVTIRAKLKPNVVFVKSMQSTTSEQPSYNPETGEVTWHIETIPATKGLLGNPIEAIFQVRATPSTDDVGQFMQILSESILHATDDFTNGELFARGVSLSTVLPDDKTINDNEGIVR